MKTFLTVSTLIAMTLTSYASLAGPGRHGHEMGMGGEPMLMEGKMGRFSLEELDINGDGQIALDEVQSQRQARFTEVDINADGYWTAEELEAYRALKHQQRFTEMDTDASGGLSFEEFIAGAPTPSQRNETRKQQHFTQMDTDGNGAISSAEFMALPRPQGPDFEDRLTRLDGDGDGMISQSEFVENVPLFDRLDSNEDGIISTEEMAQRGCHSGKNKQ